MADRRVKLILEAQVDGLKRGMDEAAKSTDRVKASAESLSRTPLKQQAREIGQEWTKASRTMQSDMRTVGTGFAAVGASIMGVYGSLVSTGIEYNTLQQVAGRSLETVMGSASAAADQMERLHEFADESPFARQVWIEAQMQLAAFGMEAERIVPTLEAVQNAVAAIGGGEQEIRQVVDILGAIEGQGKITGRELQRLGQMGIDAASMIGDAMGVSGDEIRQQITSGALDAETAITALTEGMMMRFDGAAEGMRETMTGAWDRLKAAWRDLGSVLATPLVDPDGGGGLVWLVNAAADALRVIQQLPDPVLQTVGALGGLSGVAMAGYGAMLLLVPQLVAFHDAKKRLAEIMPRTNTAIRGLGTAAAIASAGLVALSVIDSVWDSLMRVEPRDIDEITRSLEGLGRTGEWSSGVNHFGDALNSLDETGNKLKANAPGWASALASAFAPDTLSTSVDISLIQNLKEELEGTDAALAGMMANGNFDAVAENVGRMAEQFIEADRPLSKMRTDFPELDAELNKVGISFDEMLVAVGASKGVYDEANGTYQNVEVTLSQLASRLTGIDEASLEAADGSVELASALEEVGITADGTIESLQTFLELLYQTGLITMSAREAQAAYEAQLDAVDDSVQQLIDSLAEEYVQKGNSEQAARELAAEQVKLGHALNDNKTDFDLTTEAGRNAQDQFHNVMRAGMDLTEKLAENGATQSEVQAALKQTYKDTINAGVAFGMTKGDAEALTREILGIPDGVDIESWMSDEAVRVAQELNAELDRADGRRTSSNHTHTINTRRVGSTGSDRVGGPTANTIYATGGAVRGPGTGTSDSIAAWLSNGEHVLTARDVRAMGGQSGVYAMRRSLHSGNQQMPSARYMVPAYAGGGAVGTRQITEALQGMGGSGGINLGGMNFTGVTPEVVERGVTRAVFRELQSQGVPVAVPA